MLGSRQGSPDPSPRLDFAPGTYKKAQKCISLKWKWNDLPHKFKTSFCVSFPVPLQQQKFWISPYTSTFHNTTCLAFFVDKDYWKGSQLTVRIPKKIRFLGLGFTIHCIGYCFGCDYYGLKMTRVGPGFFFVFCWNLSNYFGPRGIRGMERSRKRESDKAGIPWVSIYRGKMTQNFSRAKFPLDPGAQSPFVGGH